MSFTDNDKSDNYITDKKDWFRIKDYIPTDKIIWSPFYCDGKQKEYFKDMGFNIIHEDEDFFKNNKGDIIIDNPPFSKIREICIRLKEIDKPFILILPSSKFNAVWFHNLFKNHLQIIYPMKKINCKNLDDNINFTFNWGLYYYCYKMNLPKDLIWLD